MFSTVLTKMRGEESMTPGTRIRVYDVAKGIGIVCVVLGHVLEKGITTSFIYLFHMPLFFIISGILTSNKQVGFYEFLANKLRSLLLPWFCWYLLVLGLGQSSFLLGGQSVYGVNGTAGALSAFWFVPVLFFVTLLNQIMKPVRKWLTIIFSVVLYLLVALLNSPFDFLSGGLVQKCLVVLFYFNNGILQKCAVGFFYFYVGGLFFRDSKVLWCISGLGVVVAALWLLCYPCDNLGIDMAVNKFAGFYGPFMAIPLTAFVIACSWWINQTRFSFALAGLGVSSVIIYYSHQAIHVILKDIWTNIPTYILFIITLVASLTVFFLIDRLAFLRTIFTGRISGK